MSTTRRPLSIIQRQLAQQWAQARLQTVALTVFDELDLGPLLTLRDEVKDTFLTKFGVEPGLLPYFIKAAVAALKRVPSFMSHLDGDELVESSRYDLAVAIDAAPGYLLPVLRDCDSNSIAGLALELAGLGTKARSSALEITEFQGGVLTLTQHEESGPLSSIPALNPPQSGALALHPLQYRPVYRDGRLVIRPMMHLALSYDARLMSPPTAASFLFHFKAALDAPISLLFDSQ